MQTMLRRSRVLRSLLLALIGLELLARQRSWRGLTWLNELPTRWLAMLVPLLLADRPVGGLVRTLALLPLALPVHLALASVRNHALNPLRQLEPGLHHDRRIVRIDIPMPTGHMPALLIEPSGEVQAAVCVLHGSGCDKTYYAWRITAALVQHGMAVLLVDLDGHGDSPRIQRFPEMLENPVYGIQWLRQTYQRVGLVGVSLGGNLAARAVADGLAVDALVLLEAPSQLSYTRDDMLREAWALTEPFLLDLFGESTAYHLGYTIYDLVRVQSGPRIRASIGTIDLIAQLNLLASLPRISVPLLAIYAGRDSIVRPDQAEQCRQALPQQAQFVWIPEASHLSLILHPQALTAMGSWLEKVLA